MSQQKVRLELSSPEALVLFEILNRFVETKKLETVHQAEARVLCDIQTMLEQLLEEPFASNYQQLLEQARLQVGDNL